MSEKKIVIGSGLSFTTILFFIFLILKLTETITWNWWWVFSPLWVTPVCFIGIIVFIFILFVLYKCLDGK